MKSGIMNKEAWKLYSICVSPCKTFYYMQTWAAQGPHSDILVMGGGGGGVQ